MKIIDRLVEQSRTPSGLLGVIMARTMNVMDSGLNRWALKHVDCEEGKVLDIGCGGGKTLQVLSRKYPKANFYGIDYSQTAIVTAIKLNEKKVREGNIVIEKANVSAIPYPDNYFKFVTAIRTHYFWPDLATDFREVYRVLAKYGSLIILGETYKIAYHMKRFNTHESLIQLLKDTGFVSITTNENSRCFCYIAQK